MSIEERCIASMQKAIDAIEEADKSLREHAVSIAYVTQMHQGATFAEALRSRESAREKEIRATHALRDSIKEIQELL